MLLEVSSQLSLRRKQQTAPTYLIHNRKEKQVLNQTVKDPAHTLVTVTGKVTLKTKHLWDIMAMTHHAENRDFIPTPPVHRKLESGTCTIKEAFPVEDESQASQ